MKKRTITYKDSAEIEVTSDGKIFQYGKELKKYLLGSNHDREYVYAWREDGSSKKVMVNVARAVC